MPTIKLKSFEYAGYAQKRHKETTSPHVFSALDTPNGFAFVVAGNNSEDLASDDLARIIVERMNYYLTNEVLDNTAEAVRNALIYANGFIYVMAQKGPEIQLAELSCLCVLVKDNTAYYAWVGQVCLYLFAGRKLVPLTWGLYQGNKPEGATASMPMSFLGEQQIINPGVCQKPFCPVDGDMLLLATRGFCAQANEDTIKKVLDDSMPSHTKLARLFSKFMEKNDFPVACQLIRFYNINNVERSFVPGEPLYSPENMTSALPASARFLSKSSARFLSKSSVRAVLVLCALLILSYMIYDLFLVGPRPIRHDQIPETTIVGDTIAVSDPASSETDGIAAEDETEPPGEPPNVVAEGQVDDQMPTSETIPDDIIYTVKSGDNWGRLYREFGVCSWFIRNHPPNDGKFNSANNLIAGSQILIPVIYSGKSDLNPEYHQEFSIGEVGRSCQNVDAGFRRDFEDRMLQNSQ